jgi:hypothetical protein
MSEDETRRRGRPPLDRTGPSIPVTVRFPPRHFQELLDRASRDRVSLPETIRRASAAPNKEP